MMIYQRLFAEYNQVAGQVLMTKNTMVNPVSRENAKNTFDELFRLGAIPIVNENDTVSTYEMQFGDNDTLSAIVASLIGADLLILLSDIDGLFTDDPHKNPDAKLIEVVEEMDASIYGMAKSSTGSDWNRRHGDQTDSRKDCNALGNRHDYCERQGCLHSASYI